MSQLYVINDDNFEKVVADGMHAGHGTGFMGPDPRGHTMRKFGDSYTVIPRDQWPSLIKQGQGTFLSDLIKKAKIPSKDQDGLNYCWAFASTSTAEVCFAVQGQAYEELSAESVGGPVVNWRNVGGYGTDALDQLTSTGACAASFMDAPNSLRPSRWKSGWEADCANHKITNSWASVDTFDEVITALLLRMPVSIGLDWWRHQVLLTDPHIFDTGKFGVVMRNSWGENWPSAGAGGWSILTESKSQPSGSFAAISVSALDAAWHKHAKVDSLAAVQHHQDVIARALAAHN